MRTSPILDLVTPYLSGNIKSSGPNNIMARCPFHDDSTPSFAINTENGLWICHGCGLKGGLSDFFRFAGVSRDSIDAMLEPLKGDLELHRAKSKREERYRFKISNPFLSEVILPESILGVYDFKPRALVAKDFDPKLLRRMEIGYDKEKDRIIYPIRDLYGHLVGVSGRTVIREEPRYKVYRGGRHIDGQFRTGDFGEYFDDQFPGYEVKSRNFLWNAHAVYPTVLHSQKAESVDLVIVEGFKACIWIIQHGQPNTVALMGSSMTKSQADIVMRMTDTVTLFLDNDDPGRAATYRIGKWLSRSLDVTVCQPWRPFFKQPDYLSESGLRKVFGSKMRFERWARTSSGISSRANVLTAKSDRA
jgi:DNA primase